jgi:uncharacterized membrane protein YfcA
MEPELLMVVVAGAFLAGAVDAVVGGGGLIQVPLLFAALPAASAASLFGTNKISSIFGTGLAALRYARTVAIPWRIVLPAVVAALFLSYLGAMTVALLPKEWLRPIILGLLIGVAIHVLRRPDLGVKEVDRPPRPSDPAAAAGIGGALGFYDGFFGPGTGSFLIFLFVRVFGLNFLGASAAAKAVNWATNLGALLYFLPHGHALWRLGLAMAAFNIAGAWLGSHLALRHGSRFVRMAFLVVASILIARFAYDTVSGS